MNFLSAWFGQPLMLAADAVLLLLLLASAKQALAAVTLRPAACAAAVLLTAVLWGLHVELGDGQLAGMTYHLLGISLITLMLGAPAALWLGVIMLLPYTVLLHGSANLSVIGLNALFLLLPPIAVNVALRRLSLRLPAHLFIYIFVNGFITAALGMLATGLMLMWLLEAAGVYPPQVLWASAFPVFFLLVWGEAFLTGLLTAVFVALVPGLLATFDDARYLQNKNIIWKL
ncbi:MAG: energy-coupling factor ABC transporter permease [Neisseria sp.]|nr:energy-coupling factor ABC transporter permease [Neisseria sp.]